MNTPVSMTVEEYACERYGVDIQEYTKYIDNLLLSRHLTEKEFGKEKSDDFYSVLNFIDGFTAARLTKENIKI
jgi:hypothetical protein